MRFFATCPRGLEAVLAAELAPLGAEDIAPTEGGVAFGGPFALAYRVNLESRFASRVLWEVGRTEYRDAEDLYAFVRAIDWQQKFAVERTLRVNVTASASPLTSLAYATLRIKDGYATAFATPAAPARRWTRRSRTCASTPTSTATAARSTSTPPARPCSSAGTGARPSSPAAREPGGRTVALAGWTVDQALLDPMCGSGTIAIEAAAMGLDTAPGIGREFGFMKLAAFDAAPGLTAAAARHRRRADHALRLFASDRDPRAVELARANARAAGAGAVVRFRVADVPSLTPPSPTGWIVTNPPYGVRVDDNATLAAFPSSFGRRAETAIRRLERVPDERFRSRAAQAHRAAPDTPDPAVQRRPGVPAVQFRLVSGPLRPARAGHAAGAH